MQEKHFHIRFCTCFALWIYEFGDLLIYLACLFVCSMNLYRRVRSISYV